MGIFDRVKNMFTEEVEEPKVKEQEKSVEKSKVTIRDYDDFEKETDEDEQKVEEPVTPKKEERPRPIFFDDQDFATLEKPKIKEEKVTTIEEKYYTKKVETTEKKVFKLSPVISPVYGVLDKNYHKEDITPKRSTPKVTYYDKESISIDEVRKKAYGTLEDELETSLTDDTLPKNDDVIGSRVQRKYHENTTLEDLMNPDYKVEDDTSNEKAQTLEPIALEDFLGKEPINDNKEEDYKDPLDDTLTESDLFHLIDSMYDKEEK